MASSLEVVGEDAATEMPFTARGGSDSAGGGLNGSNSSILQVRVMFYDRTVFFLLSTRLYSETCSIHMLHTLIRECTIGVTAPSLCFQRVNGSEPLANSQIEEDAAQGSRLFCSVPVRFTCWTDCTTDAQRQRITALSAE